MQREDSVNPKDWFRIGDKEIRRVEILLNAGDLEGAGFNIQQALEKYLKGYLLSKGWKLRKTHNLILLLNEVIVHGPSFSTYIDSCQKITQYYVEERYPSFMESRFSPEEIKESLQIAKKIIDQIRTLTNLDERDR